MSRPDNLIGQTFGFLTVLEKDVDYKKRNHLNPNSGAYWKCQCICGNITSVRGSALKSGSIKSCGCKWKELQRQSNMVDITNKKFGKLTAIKPVFNYAEIAHIKNSGNIIFWECLCDCGNTTIVAGTDLRQGKITSCKKCSTSKNELKIQQLLTKYNIPFIYNQAYFKDLKNPSNTHTLSYDFIILNDNAIPIYLIEYDGEQHFHAIQHFGGEQRLNKQQEYDKIKNQYAIQHNLPLIRIPYTHKNIQITDLLLETTTFLINEA